MIASDPDGEWDWEEQIKCEEPWLELFVAEIAGQPIGFIQIINPARETSRYWGGMPEGYRAIDIWIGELKNTGQGYGGQMMNLALEHCFGQADVHTVLIDPLATNTRAIKFYETIGFHYVEDRDFGGDRCKVYQISRSDFAALT